MMTRREYMDTPVEDRAEAHRAYYSQFVSEYTKSLVLSHVATKKELMASTEQAFNDIPLARWDRAYVGPKDKMRELGDFPSLAGSVCILKEAARQIVEEG